MEYYGPPSKFLLQFGTKINIFEDMEQTRVGPNKIAPIATCRPQLYVQLNKKNHAILYILYIMHLLYVYYYFLCIIKCVQDEERVFKVHEPSDHHVKDGGINRVPL
jgi:hypothetical protein